MATATWMPSSGNNFGDTPVPAQHRHGRAPAFAASSTNPFGLSDVGIYATPAFVDIDGDGDLDFFDGAQYFENLPTYGTWLPLALSSG